MTELTTRLADALAPFTANVFKPVGRNAFSITVTGGAIHDAREALREYRENYEITSLSITATASDSTVQRKALSELLAASRKAKVSEALVKAVEDTFAPLLATS